MSQEKKIRIFISSTFSDMQLEREVLIKQTFPVLRAWCREKGYDLMEIDLRWGITTSEAEAGQVIPICLREVEECMPFFIGIIGDRYGTTKQTFPNLLLQKYPWLEDYLGRSITEFEIVHGALGDHVKYSNAIFYIRHSQFYEGLPEGVDQKMFFERSPEGQEHLRRLKDRIKASSFPSYEYQSAELLGQLMQVHIKRLLEEKVFIHEDTDPYEIYSKNLAKRLIGRENELEGISKFVNSKQNALVLTGPVGMGKSTILAAWYKQQQTFPEKTIGKNNFWGKIFSGKKDNNGHLILSHQVGATSTSKSWRVLIRRTIEQAKKHLLIDIPIPNSPTQYRIALFELFYSIESIDKKVILIIDGIDELEDEDQAIDLTWLPEAIPSNLKLILSASSNEMLPVFQSRNFKFLHLAHISETSRLEIGKTFLSEFGKTLALSELQKVTQHIPTGNPFFLKLLLEELRVFGSHQKLQKHLLDYINTASSKELFKQIVRRLKDDFNTKHPDLVKNALTLIAFSRKGLYENEILKILGGEKEPLPSLYWTPVFHAIKGVLIVRDGLISFANRTFEEGIFEMYESDVHSKAYSHESLINFFVQLPVSIRKIETLPWHYAALGKWDKLADLLSEPEFIRKAWKLHSYEVTRYWSELLKTGHSSLMIAYKKILRDVELFQQCYEPITYLFESFGQSNLLKPFLGKLLVRCKKENDFDRLQLILAKLGKISFEEYDYNSALDQFELQEKIAVKNNLKTALAYSFSNQAGIYRLDLQFDKTNALYQKAYDLFTEEKNLQGQVDALGNLAALKIEKERFNEAEDLLVEQLFLARQISDYNAIVEAQSRLAFVFAKRDEFGIALEYLEKVERLSEQIGNLYIQFDCLKWRAFVKMEQADYDAAHDVLEQQALIINQLKDIKLKALNLSHFAHMYAFKINQPEYALSYIKNAHALATKYNQLDIIPQLEQQYSVVRALI